VVPIEVVIVWQMHRHHMLKHRYGPIETGTVVGVEHDWVETFVLLPHKTIGGRWVWMRRIYCRRVWVYTGFIDEPETQYGTLFDILRWS